MVEFLSPLICQIRAHYLAFRAEEVQIQIQIPLVAEIQNPLVANIQFPLVEEVQIQTPLVVEVQNPTVAHV
jgi:hypothetical protein